LCEVVGEISADGNGGGIEPAVGVIEAAQKGSGVDGFVAGGDQMLLKGGEIMIGEGVHGGCCSGFCGAVKLLEGRPRGDDRYVDRPTMRLVIMSEMVACKSCGQIHAAEPLGPGMMGVCSRCGVAVAKRISYSLHWTGALSLAALILYVPANVFPILRLEMYGASSDNTVWSGCKRLFQDGDWAIAVIVFLASILIPLLKLGSLFTLVAFSKLKISWWKRPRNWMYWFVDSIGRWAMLDVFVVAILVSLVKLQKLATIIPGKGLIAFSGVVVLTLLASASFDPQLIWESKEGES
jgi:paraquat-inducible protein A